MEGNVYGEPERDTKLDSQTLEPPVRVTAAGGSGGEVPSAGYYPPSAPEASGGAPSQDYRSSGHTPIHSGLETQANSKGDIVYNSRHLQPRNLVVTSLVLRAAAAVSLIVGIAVLASNSATLIDSSILTGLTFDVSSFSSTRYALAVAIIGAVYSIFEAVSAAVRLAMHHPMLPRNISLFISYIGDQVVIVLLLSGASAAAATLRDLHVLQPNFDGLTYCDYMSNWCNQGAGGVAMIFLGFCFVAASLVISSYCFYTGRS